jgi:hypothetical protein
LLFEKPDRIEEVGDNGLTTRLDGKMFVSRKNLEELKIPKDSFGYHISVGDIIQLFSKSTNTWYFEVINVDRDGFEHDSEVWTQYELGVARNQSFTPEKKL